MARLFDDASSQRLEINLAVIAAVPLTLACWFRSNDLTVTQDLIAIADKDVDTHYFRLIADGAAVGDPVSAVARGGGTSAIAVTSAGYTANTWQHACAVFTSATSRAAFLDGANKGTEATNATPAGMDRTSIGRLGRLTATAYMSGEIAEAAVYSVALADAEVLMLSLGVSPLMVRPDALVAYWPLLGRYSPETDPVGAFDLTVTGATYADHPRIIYPRRSRVWQPAAVAAGSLRRLLLLGAG